MKSNLTLLFGLLLFSTLHAQIPAYVPTDGLVGWWPFNGNANDESGNGNDGVVNGATLAEDRFGNAGSAYSFDGSTVTPTYISGDCSNFPTASRTVSLWFYANDIGSTFEGRALLGYGGATCGQSWLMNVDNPGNGGNIFEVQGHCQNEQLLYDYGSLNPNSSWYHWLVTTDTDGTKFYLNGQLVQENDIFIDETVVSGRVFIFGGMVSNNGLNFFWNISANPFNGLLDDIAIYNRALTEQEIQNLYAGTTPAACPPLSANLQTGLVGYWPFCGNANDESGNGNDGVVNGATLTEDRFGNAASAYGFNGTNSFIQYEADNLPISTRSVSAWFYSTNIGEGPSGRAILGYGGQSCGQSWNMLLDNAGSPQGPDSYEVNSHCNVFSITSNYGADAPIGAWHHWVAVTSSLGTQFYVDGELVSTDPAFINNTVVAGKDFCIGAYTNTNGVGALITDPNNTPWNGLLDDIAIWNRALTPAEVHELYTGQPVTPPVTCTPLPSNLQTGLVGYWPFCGNANDESGSGNDGVVNGATLTEDRFGNANAAYGFDGVDDDIDITNLSINGDVSVSFWKRIENMNFSYPIGLGINPIFNLGFGIGIGFLSSGCGYQDSTLFVYDGADGCSNVMLSAPFLAEGVWYHTSFVRENGVSKLYENGSLIAESVNLDFPTLSNITFGRRSDNASPFNGTLDDITIYNRALTPAEVQELYTLDACTFTVYDTLTVENIINVYDTLTIENIVDIYDTIYINVEVYDTLTIENIVEVYDTITVENVIDVFDTTTVVETVVVFDTLTVENVIDVFDTTTVVETVVVFDTLTVENVIDVFDTTTVVETVVVFDTLTVENVIDVYDTTYVTVTDTLIIDIPSGVGGNILNTLLLYPNPTSDQLTISYGNFAAMAGYSLSIFDNGGSAVHETTIIQAQETLDITQWSAGVYQVVVYNAGGVPVETRQIVIQ